MCWLMTEVSFMMFCLSSFSPRSQYRTYISKETEILFHPSFPLLLHVFINTINLSPVQHDVYFILC